MPSPHDHWWDVDEATNVDALAMFTLLPSTSLVM